jgi:hypothetical protein
MTPGVKILMVIDALGWGPLVLIYGSAVIGLHDRGQNILPAANGLAILILILLASTVGPLLLARSHWHGTAFTLVWLSMIALLPAYIFTLALAAI